MDGLPVYEICEPQDILTAAEHLRVKRLMADIDTAVDAMEAACPSVVVRVTIVVGKAENMCTDHQRN